MRGRRERAYRSRLSVGIAADASAELPGKLPGSGRPPEAASPTAGVSSAVCCGSSAFCHFPLNWGGSKSADGVCSDPSDTSGAVRVSEAAGARPGAGGAARHDVQSGLQLLPALRAAARVLYGRHSAVRAGIRLAAGPGRRKGSPVAAGCRDPLCPALPPLVLAVTALFAQNAGSILRPVIRLYYPAVVQPLGRFLIQQLAPFAAAVCGFLGWKR